MDETTLIRLAQKGNREALEQLLRDNYRTVRGYLLRVTLNTSLADDLTQETMLRAILNIRRWQPWAKFSTWLITIANNLYRDALKKNRASGRWMRMQGISKGVRPASRRRRSIALSRRNSGRCWLSCPTKSGQC